VPLQIRTKEEMKSIIDKFPFTGDEDIKRLAVVFLAEKPAHIPIEEIEKYKAERDEIVFENQEIYLYIPEGFGKSKLDNNRFERRLQVKATTRNWRTVNKLNDMCK